MAALVQPSCKTPADAGYIPENRARQEGAQQRKHTRSRLSFTWVSSSLAAVGLLVKLIRGWSTATISS